MAFASDSTRTPSTGGPVTQAIAAMRVEPEPAPQEGVAAGRRLFLRAVAALPLVGTLIGAMGEAEAADMPEHEARFLALVPWLAEVVPPAERVQWAARTLYGEAVDGAGPHPGWTVPKVAREWARAAQAIRETNGYSAAWAEANAAAKPIAEAYGEYRDASMTTVKAIAWKARLSLLLDESDDPILSDMASLVGRT